MNHRHIEVVSGTPVEAQPLAAIVDILQRGDLAEWRPIARAILRDPMGEFADRVLRLVDAYPMYGTSSLWRSWIDRCRARAEDGSPSTEVGLSTVRRRLGLTQVEVAGRMGISQSDLSKLERRRDLRLSTLRSYAQALRGGIRVLFVSADSSAAIRTGGTTGSGSP